MQLISCELHPIERNDKSQFKPITTEWQTLIMVGWLCCTSHRQRGHLEAAPPFTVPCEG